MMIEKKDRPAGNGTASKSFAGDTSSVVEKTCTRCRESKPLEMFNRDSMTIDGRKRRCKSCVRSYSRAYRSQAPHKGWEGRYLHRAKSYGFTPVVQSFTRDDLIDRYGDACFHCGGPFEHLDHYPMAVRDGGVHTLENCVPSCATCNQSGSRADHETHCIHGHPWTDENTQWYAGGKYRQCRECKRVQGREAYAERKSVAA